MTTTGTVTGPPPLPPQWGGPLPALPPLSALKEPPDPRDADGRPPRWHPTSLPKGRAPPGPHLRWGAAIPRVVRQVGAAGLGQEEAEQPPRHRGAPEDGHGDGPVVAAQEAGQRGHDPRQPRRHGAQSHAGLPGEARGGGQGWASPGTERGRGRRPGSGRGGGKLRGGGRPHLTTVGKSSAE